MESKILEKLKYKLKEKVENLKKLNKSFYTHDQSEELFKFYDLYFENLQNVYKFNLNDSTQEIDLIEKNINAKLDEYNKTKKQLKVDFNYIMETYNCIKSINIYSDEIKIDA